MSQILRWTEADQDFEKEWIAESDFPAPTCILIANDQTTADEFYHRASEGAAYIYRGDFQNAKQLLVAVQKRIERKAQERLTRDLEEGIASARERFFKYRQAQGHRAQLLARLLISVDEALKIPLRRAPNVELALREALGCASGDFLISLRELLGIIGAHEWRKKGVPVAVLGANIHPYYGIFSPTRQEYLELAAKAPLPSPINLAFDIGTGTGVIAALLARRCVPKVIATDSSPRAVACAIENINRLGLEQIVTVEQREFFPPSRADLVVCNPPWLPNKAKSDLERGIYDEDSAMLRGFLSGVCDHLTDSGEAWLIMSDLAENLGLRNADDLPTWIEGAGLMTIERLETRPKHGKASDSSDPLHFARSREVTRLWRLKKNK
jgi:SAM-dependent methyltransferase